MCTIRAILLIAALFFSCLPWSETAFAGGNILYIPMDERALNKEYVWETLRQVSPDISMPPDNLMPNCKEPADIEGLWTWIYNNAGNADCIVLSADAVLYGGLVPSRRHNISQGELTERLNRFKQVKGINPGIRIYAFSTLMRTPRYNGSEEEPDYCSEYGSAIYKLTALLDREERGPLTDMEAAELKRLNNSIPADVRNDWFGRRNKNLRVNQRLIENLQAGTLDYLVIGRDDCASYGQSSREFRVLGKSVEVISPDRFTAFPGADEVGLLLLTRAVNRCGDTLPSVYVSYAPGVGGDTVPGYEDQRVEISINQRILAAGGRIAKNAAEADLILHVNTPEDGVTGETAYPDKHKRNLSSLSLFAQRIIEDIDRGKRVALADIALSNGGDDVLMNILSSNHVLTKLEAYAGLNTAGNAIGYALCQGMLAADMPLEAKNNLLAVRLIDDWGYQSLVRRQIEREYLTDKNLNQNNLGHMEIFVRGEIRERLSRFAKEHLSEFGIKTIETDLTWSRAFNIVVRLQ